MNRKFPFLLAATAALAFAAGFAAVPVFLSGRAANKNGPGTADLPSSSSSRGMTGLSDRALPLAIADGRPQSTDQLVAGFIEAARDPNYSHRSGRLWWLSENLTSSNAQEVVEAVIKGARGTERDYLTTVLFNSWSKIDAKGALAYAKEMPRGRQRDQAMLGAVAGWASSNFEAASRWVDQLPSGQLKRGATQQLINTLAETDPESALKLALEKAKTSGGFSYAYSIFPAMVTRNPEKAAERAASLPAGNFRSEALRAVASSWGEMDRTAALAWIEKIPEGPAKQETFSSVLEDWVRSDFDGSLAWLQKRPEGIARDRILQSLSFVTASDNPENALKLVDLVTSNSSQDEMLQEIARVWSRNDPAAAQQWADSQTDSGVKKAAWRGVVYGMSSEYPEQAAAFALKLPDEQRSEAIGNVASSWARQDPAAAATWAGALTDANSRTGALGGVMASWVNDDPAAALKWYSSAPAGKERDSVIGRFVYTLSQSDPNLAVQWAQSIQDEKQRMSRLENVAGNWMRNDPASASTWVANSQLSPEVKKSLLSRPR